MTDISDRIKAAGVRDDPTLRDWFAAHAPEMPGYWHTSALSKNGMENIKRMNAGKPPVKIRSDLEIMVSWRWAYADAMIAARATPPQDAP